VIPWLFGSGTPNFVASVVLSALAVFAVGAGVSLFTGRNPLFAGVRQLAIAAAAAVVTFSIGKLIGVNAT
jgi:VIT1/CCC1 family predicted Fe2+/Mn2+ transporter